MPEPMPEPMPEEVRARLVSLAAEALPGVPGLPPALRRVADFAPARRARAGGNLITRALADDPGLGERIAVQLAERRPDLAQLLGDVTGVGSVPDTADPVDLAAALWLRRPDAWEEAYAAALERVREAGAAAGERRDTERLEQAAARADEAETALHDVRRRQRDERGALKAEIASLRQRLGAARASEREARDALAGVSGDREAARGEMAEALRDAEKEARRLRTRVEELEAAAGEARARDRTGREEASTRARLLLDTVIDSAAGLRRELALPAPGPSPGERVEAELAAQWPEAAGAAGDGPTHVSPLLLEELLSRPRSRLLVDGYNVTKTAWPEATLENQRVRLVQALAALVSRTGAETTVVFDAAGSTHRPVVPGPTSVRVAWSPPGVIADDVIRGLVDAEPAGRVVVVVTSDREVQRDVARSGARAVAAEVLVATLR